MDTYFEVENVVATRQDRATFKRAKNLFRARKLEVLSQDQVRGIQYAAEESQDWDLADAAKTICELWDALEE